MQLTVLKRQDNFLWLGVCVIHPPPHGCAGEALAQKGQVAQW